MSNTFLFSYILGKRGVGDEGPTVGEGGGGSPLNIRPGTTPLLPDKLSKRKYITFQIFVSFITSRMYFIIGSEFVLLV